jgi:hypothetical protein
MRKMLLHAVLLVLAITAPASTHACSCECKNRGANDPREMMHEARAVFVGEVLEIRESTPDEQRHHSDLAVARMRIERYWKGVKTQEILISAVGIARGGCCDIALAVGHKYLVYAVRKDLSTGCTRTQPLEQSEEDLKVLGTGKTLTK